VDEHELELFRTSVRHTLDSTPANDLRVRLADEGWFELFAEEPAVAVGILFEEQGRGLASSGMLDDVVLAELAASLGPVADQAGRRVVLYPPPASSGGASSIVDEHARQVRLEGVTSGALLSDDVLVVPVHSPAGTGVFVVSAGDTVASTALGGLDPDAGRHRVDAAVALADGTLVWLPPGTWDRAVDRGRRALAHELVGLTEQMLAMAVEHVTDRHQFGRPLGAFQAVQQRLADVAIALSGARAAVRAAWTEPEGLVAAMAKALASAAHETAARECQQVMGGIGFTWEHPLHRYIRRGYALDAFLGSVRTLERQVGERLVSTRQVPRVPFAIDIAEPARA
jgi:CBS domain-containing protein